LPSTVLIEHTVQTGELNFHPIDLFLSANKVFACKHASSFDMILLLLGESQRITALELGHLERVGSISPLLGCLEVVQKTN
jgi:hypothetical protein